MQNIHCFNYREQAVQTNLNRLTKKKKVQKKYNCTILKCDKVMLFEY